MIRHPLRLIPTFVSVVLLIASVCITAAYGEPLAEPAAASFSEASSLTESSQTQPQSSADGQAEEMRGVWIPFMSLDIGSGDNSEKAFQEKIDGILDACVQKKMNTVFVHVRPFGDALYPSKYFPWSHTLTGKQGENPNYDPLEYIVSAARQRNLKIHAWVNPLRIRYNKTPAELSEDNPHVLWHNDDISENDNYTVEYDNGIYFNPAYSEVRKYIIDGIIEIVKSYDIDGIHFDDYFYPTEDTEFDKEAYNSYCESLDENAKPLSLSEWRKNNINTLIAGVYSAVHNTKSDVVFGISPQGNIENDEKLYADVTQWCSVRGYIDYICPQIYVSNTHPFLPFPDTARRWRELVTCDGIKLYCGLGLYKAGTDDDEGTWLKSNEEIKTQIESVRSLNYDGFALYSYEYLENTQTKEEIQNVMALLEN